MSEAVCPSCGAQVNVKGTPKIGLSVTCKSCDTQLEVVWLDPLEMDWPMDEYEGELEDEVDSVEDED